MKLTKRELATVLAALRCWQSGDEIDSIDRQMLKDIASDGKTLKPLTKKEIDALCERINS